MRVIFDPIVAFLLQCYLGIEGFIDVIFKNKNISYGLSIIVFTLLIKSILLPLSLKAMKSQLRMTEIQPEMKKIQEKYKKDPQKLNEETMKLYKDKGVNPLGGCLPLLIQMPVLSALYYVFQQHQFVGINFMWLADLSKPDHIFILPLLSGATTYISSTLLAAKDGSPQAKQASTMNIVMGAMLTFMSLNMSSGLVIYWIFGNIFQISQTLIIKKSNSKKSLEEV